MHKFKFALLGIAALALAGCSETTGSKEGIGTLLGAVAGGVAGSQVGDGRGQLVATGVGTLLGAIIGSEIGKSLDRADQLALQHQTQNTLENAPSGTTDTWHNPDSGNSGTITPTQTYQQNDGTYCREFTQTVTVAGETQQAYGTACRQPDGTWQIVS